MEDKLKGIIGCLWLYNSYFKTFGLRGNEKVLDFGCGGGAGSKCLAKLLKEDGHLTCIDISNYWIERATKRLDRYANVECHAGDIRSMNIPDNSFHVISIFQVIHDIAPQDRQSTVDALGRKLKTSGTVFVRERIQKSHGMPVAEIRTLFANAGFSEVDHQESRAEYIGRFKPVRSNC